MSDQTEASDLREQFAASLFAAGSLTSRQVAVLEDPAIIYPTTFGIWDPDADEWLNDDFVPYEFGTPSAALSAIKLHRKYKYKPGLRVARFRPDGEDPQSDDFWEPQSCSSPSSQ